MSGIVSHVLRGTKCDFDDKGNSKSSLRPYEVLVHIPVSITRSSVRLYVRKVQILVLHAVVLGQETVDVGRVVPTGVSKKEIDELGGDVVCLWVDDTHRAVDRVHAHASNFCLL